MRKVPVIDASGMYALKEFYNKCSKEGTKLVLSGVSDRLLKKLRKFGLTDLIRKDQIFPDINAAIHYAKQHVKDSK